MTFNESSLLKRKNIRICKFGTVLKNTYTGSSARNTLTETRRIVLIHLIYSDVAGLTESKHWENIYEMLGGMQEPTRAFWAALVMLKSFLGPQKSHSFIYMLKQGSVETFLLSSFSEYLETHQLLSLSDPLSLCPGALSSQPPEEANLCSPLHPSLCVPHTATTVLSYSQLWGASDADCEAQPKV